MYGPGAFLYTIFLMISWVILIYSINFYYLAYLSRNNVRYEKKRREKIDLPANLPIVTIQLPLYNEKYVARRLIDAVCQIDYPKDKLEIQVLDDSDDDTVDLIQSIVDEYRFKGFDMVHIHRVDRTGYKAGALKAGLKISKGEFVAIFDADFIPPRHFLKHLIKYFNDPKMGFVQCKWGHINEDFSTLTSAQAVSLDLHFLVEQKAKSFTHYFMNFNGTAGVWRRACIDDAGGWHTTTLVEDMDLSYRAHMRGWRSLFLDDIVVDAELPVQMNATKRQQFRWAKGAMQVALKLLADVLISRKVPVDTKLQSFIHMTRHIVNPLFLTQFLIFPMLLAMDFKLYTESWAPFLVLGTYIALGPGGYLAVINQTWKDQWRKKAWQFLFLNFLAAGITVNNTVAVFDAILGKKNEFLRTPKFGVVNKNDDWRGKEYVLPFTKTTLLEIFFAVYGFVAVFISMFSGNPVYAPMIAIPTIGFVYTAYLSIAHSSFKKKRPGAPKSIVPAIEAKGGSTVTTATAVEKTRISHNVNQRIVLAGVMIFIILGGAIAYQGYISAIYPANMALGYLIRAQSAQTPGQLAEYMELTKDALPEEGNPVWLFQTVRTDFVLIQDTLDDVIVRADLTKSIDPHSAAYNVAMIDMHDTADALESNLLEALPYMFVSIGNMIYASVWVLAIIVIFAAMRMVNGKARAKYEQQFKTV
ncbi:MAG TPA: glycosyltransferase [Nitrososphaera sp.]|jgi:cellulose synthase/poly-beta-1,6-N-acetylglucosamine synthase-like glycosyltransferase|nr:glycosyltransferase [Nitrososphaera sp.]